MDSTTLADDFIIEDLPVGSNGKYKPLTLLRVRSTGLLCADSLKRFHAKNISDSAITLKAGSFLVGTLHAGQDHQYATLDFWDDRYFDLDMKYLDGKSGGTIATENGSESNQMFTLDASDESGHAEHWELKFEVSGFHCSASIKQAPKGREVEIS